MSLTQDARQDERSPICLPAVCQLARDSIQSRAKRERERESDLSKHRSRSLDLIRDFSVFSEEIYFFFFFLVHVESDSKKRNRIFVRGF